MASTFIQKLRTLWTMIGLARRKRIDFVAGGITYYEFFAVVPLLLLSFVLLSTVGGEQLASTLIISAGAFLPPIGQELIHEVLEQDAGRTSLIGLLILAWASLQLFRSFNVAFDQIYETDHAVSLIEELEDAIVALATISIAILFAVAAAAFIHTFPGAQLTGLLWTMAQVAGLTAVFIPFYHVFTDKAYAIRDLLPGALVAAAGWAFLQSMFQLYTHLIGGSLYEVFGGVLLLVFWMYLGNIIILFGAVVNLVHNR